MNEYLKMIWQIDSTQLSSEFIPEDDIGESFIFKSFDKFPNFKQKTVKLNVNKARYVPGKKYYLLIKRRSLLTKLQKKECLCAMKLIQAGYRPESLTERQKSCLQTYTACHSKITDENRLFLTHTQTMWEKNAQKNFLCRPGIFKFSWPRWMEKLDRYFYYPQHYKDLKCFSLTFDENEANIEFHHSGNILESGVLARFNHPTFLEPCCLRLKDLEQVPVCDFTSNLPVSQDETVVRLAENNDFDVVISSSGLKQLLDANNKRKWMIPVCVKEVLCNNKPKTVVFIDKVLPKTTPSCSDLNNYAFKRLLKVQFCQYEAFEFGEVENSDMDDNKKKIHYNVNYKIWNIKRTDTMSSLMKNKSQDQSINLLIRSKLDACEAQDRDVLFPVILRPKIEQQLQYGANICSKSEITRDWGSLFFRIYSNLYRARIYAPNSEIVALEKCSLQKLTSEAQTHYNYKPANGLGVLQKIFAELLLLEPGNYLLQHLPKNDTFLKILKECDKTTENLYDLHAECEDPHVDTAFKSHWLPIDVNYILPVHEEYNKIPAVFNGFDADGHQKKILLSKNKSRKRRKNKTNTIL